MQYIEQIKKIQQISECKNTPIGFYSLLRLPECIKTKTSAFPIAEIKAQLFESLDNTYEIFDKMRMAEGKNLEVNIREYLENIKTNLEIIKSELPESINKRREKLTSIVKEIIVENSEDFERKIMVEIGFFVEKVDVSEELDRLSSHIFEFERIINLDETAEPSGRTLEFLLQEMLREINTCSVKSLSVKISHSAVAVKNSLDKIKEQIMNIV